MINEGLIYTEQKLIDIDKLEFMEHLSKSMTHIRNQRKVKTVRRVVKVRGTNENEHSANQRNISRDH